MHRFFQVRCLLHAATLMLGLGLSLFLVGCGPSADPNVYSDHGSGMSASVEPGIILETRNVQIKSSKGTTGAILGATAGGVGGSFIGSSGASRLIGGIAGAAVGGLAGSYIDKQLKSGDATQYIIKLTKTDKTISVVQNKTPALSKGQHVLVLINAQRTRVIPDNGSTPTT